MLWVRRDLKDLPLEQVPSQAQLHCSFPSAHSSFGSARSWDHRDNPPWMIWG